LKASTRASGSPPGLGSEDDAEDAGSDGQDHDTSGAAGQGVSGCLEWGYGVSGFPVVDPASFGSFETGSADPAQEDAGDEDEAKCDE
jgi:hypothetical protein